MFIIRFLLKMLFRAYFKIFHNAEITGMENLKIVEPRTVYAINHLSFLDGCFVAAYLPGNPIFAIDTEQAKRFWWLKYIIDVYPVDPENPMSAKGMIKAIRSGRQLVIFPEGRLTLTGALMKVYGGPATIADKADAVLQPIKIDGLQYHVSSRMDGTYKLRYFPKFTMHVMPHLYLRDMVDSQLVGVARKRALRAALQDVMVEAAFQPNTKQSLFKALVDARNKYDVGQVVIADVKRFRLTYNDIILRSIILGRKLKKHTSRGEAVGIMLPNSTTAVATFFALQAYRRVPDMLNFSAGLESILSTINTGKVNTIVTSHEFVKKAGLEHVITALSDKNVLYVEDIRDSVNVINKVVGKLLSKFVWMLPGYHSKGNELAVILNTSGSEGTPKGVALSHSNILSNNRQVTSVIAIHPRRRFMTSLPMFHSMGLSAGTLLPLYNGAYTFLYPSPLHYGIIPEIIYQEQATVFFATCTFLKGYARKADPEDLHSVDYIVAGAEAVDDEVRNTYIEKFQKVIYEGYGATECAPVIALNTPAHFKLGTVGRMVPGMQRKLVEVPGAGDQLYVKGPNVMLGYLKADQPGVIQTIEDGWYDTGDIFQFIGNNFMKFVDRAKRIAKIAGEMVSLLAAEKFVTSVLPDDLHAVVSIPDARKGEALVLVTTNQKVVLSDLMEAARAKGIAELFVPRTILSVDKMPLLGTGKINHPEVKKLVAEKLLK